MTTNYSDAYDSITTELQTYVAANSIPIIGKVPEIRFYAVPEQGIPTDYFIRFMMQPVRDAQSSFRQTDGQRYAATGLISLDVFAPRKDRTSYKKMRLLSMMLQKRFRKAIDCIVMRNVRINDLAAEDIFWRQVVIAEYSYDEIQTG